MSHMYMYMIADASHNVILYMLPTYIHVHTYLQVTS